MFIPMLMPMIPTWNEKPPTLYSILESIVNFDKEDKTKIKDLAKESRSTIFNFNYPLSDKVTKEDFECMILNHFIMRRIGFETVTAFRIQLNVKLNEIMPMYNKMFDMLDGWDIFNDGEKVIREVIDSRNIKTTSESTTENSSNTTSENSSNTSNDNITSTDTTSANTIENSAETIGQNISDNRNSDTPQNRLAEVRSGEYVDDYKYTQDNSTSTDESSSTGSSTSSTDTTNNTSIETEAQTTTDVEGQSSTNSEDNTENKGNTKETIIRTPSDKLKLYQDFIENRQNIYTMIFKDLEDLFYQLV